MKSRRSIFTSLILVLTIAFTAFAATACDKTSDITVTFMDGDEVYRTITLEEGAEITGLQLPIRTGYTFTGWVDADGAEFVPTSVPSSDITVYAAYSANAYNIAFDYAGGGTTYGSLTTISTVYDADVTLPADGLTDANGHGISGYTDLEGSSDPKWLAGATVKNLTAEADATVTLYVIFGENIQPLDFIVENGVVTGYEGYSEIVRLPDNATSVADFAFSEATFVRQLIVPETYTSIGYGAFADMSSLEKLTVPFIGGGSEDDAYLAYIFGAGSYINNTFSYNMAPVTDESGNIIDIAVDESSLTGEFYIPRTLRVVTINAPIEEISEGAFYYAYGLEKVIFYEYYYDEEETPYYAYPVRTVGAHAFEGCHRLGFDSEINAAVSLPWMADVEIFGDYSFAGLLAGNYFASNLNRVGELTAAIEIGANAFEYSRAYDISFGENLVSIGAYAFQRNMFFQKVNIPDSVRTIGESAFFACDYLTSIEIGTGVESIGAGAFAVSLSLAEVYFRGDNPISLGALAFAGLSSEYEPVPEGNPGLAFVYATPESQSAISPSLSSYSNGTHHIISANRDETVYYYLGGSSYAFTIEFGPYNTIYLDDPYNRSGFGLPYMIGVVEKVPTALLYDNEDIYITSFMGGRLFFSLRKTITYTGRYTHYYNYEVPAMDIRQITNDALVAFFAEGETAAVTFGEDGDEWIIKENIFGQIGLWHDGAYVELGTDYNGLPLEEEAFMATGGIAQTSADHTPITLVYRQGNKFFEPILTYYFAYRSDPADNIAEGKFVGELVLDDSANRTTAVGDFQNYLYGTYNSIDYDVEISGEVTSGVSLYVDEVSNTLTISGEFFDGKTIEYDGGFHAEASYGNVASATTTSVVYGSIPFSPIQIGDGPDTFTITFYDFMTDLMDMQDQRFINAYAMCEIEFSTGETYRLYLNKAYALQSCYSLNSRTQARQDYYTIITFRREVVEDDISQTLYPSYFEYFDPSTSEHKVGTLYSDVILETYTSIYRVSYSDGSAANFTILDDLGSFTAPYGNTGRTRDYISFYEDEADMTFTNGRVSITTDGYGNGAYYIDGEKQWDGKYYANLDAAVANVFVTANTYYTMYEYVLTSNDRVHTVYFAPNFFDAYDGTLMRGDMILPDSTRNKTYVSRDYTSSGDPVYTSLLACSGYGMAYFYILTYPNGNVVPIDYAQISAAGVSMVNYEHLYGDTYRIVDLYGEGFFLCDFTEDMIQVSDTASYREMVIAEDYMNWWSERTAVQLTGDISPNMYDFDRMESREDRGTYITPDGYILKLDGYGAAVLYDNSGATEESNILAVGEFLSVDGGEISALSFTAYIALTFDGETDPVLFEGEIYTCGPGFSTYIYIPIVTPNGLNINGFAKAGSIVETYTANGGEYDGDKIIVYNDGYAGYFDSSTGTSERGLYSADYTSNPDPTNAVGGTPVTGENLHAVRVATRKIIFTVDGNDNLTISGVFGTRKFEFGLYEPTVYIAFNLESTMVQATDEKGNGIFENGRPVQATDENGNPLFYEPVMMYGYEVRGIRNEEGIVVAKTQDGNEYASTTFRFYSDEEKAADEDLYDYYSYFGTEYENSWTLYEDGEVIVDYVYLGIIRQIRTGWYYEVRDGDTLTSAYFVMDLHTGPVLYTLTAEEEEVEE